MYDRDLVIEILEQILTASNRIERRFVGISKPDDLKLHGIRQHYCQVKAYIGKQ